MTNGVECEISFEGDRVYRFKSSPEEPLSSLFEQNAKVNHGFSGKIDGGEMPKLKNTGHYALLARAIMVGRVSVHA